MFQIFLLVFREGLEAAIIIAIMLAFLKRTENKALFKNIWQAVFSAISVCVLLGTVIFATVGEFEGRGEEIFEGTMMLLAAVVITHVWRHTTNTAQKTKAKIERALADTKAQRAIFVAAFVAVMIEGLEIVLYMLATARHQTFNLAVGSIIGIALASAVGFILYQTNRIANAKTFFSVLGLLLIFIAAGLVAHGIHEFQEANLFPVLREDIWNLNNIPVVSENAGLGKFTKAIFGYNGNPELLEFMAWISYLTIALRITGMHRVFFFHKKHDAVVSS